MAVFDWAESAGSSVDYKPRVARTQFGDGYVERAPDGLNPMGESWSLAFNDISDEAGTEIITFLKARFTGPLGQEAFDWTPLWASTPIRVTCDQFTRTLGSRVGTCSVQAVFVREFVA